MTSFSIIRPDDLHVHLRDGKIMEAVVKDSARQFGRVLAMPNLVPPVTKAADAKAYYDRIKNAAGIDGFEPLMTLYLTDNTTSQDIEDAVKSGVVKATKLYPAGATTNSSSGVTDLKKIYKVLEAQEKHGLIFTIHGEVTDKAVDVFDREAEFIDRILVDVVKNFPNLKIVFEHITTKQAAQFVESSKDNIAATITAHHLLFNRNDMLVGGVRPHYFCLPILKREEHRKALVAAALSDSGKYFAGTDSAPHLQHRKENSCGCAGCYTAYHAVELYAQCFDDAEDLSKPATQKKFENFMSRFGAKFYGIGENRDKINLAKEKQKIPEFIDTAEGKVIPLLAGEEVNWTVKYA